MIVVLFVLQQFFLFDGVFMVVIDVGYGGIDIGVVIFGKNLVYEKNIMFDFVILLVCEFNVWFGIKVFLMCDIDIFLLFGECVQIVCVCGVNFFILLYVDMLWEKFMCGVIVYMILDCVLDKLVDELVKCENMFDEVVGVEVKKELFEVNDILIDLMWCEMQVFLISFVNLIVYFFEGQIGLINNLYCLVGFCVLMVLDVFLVFLEFGFLFNSEDVK